jgi:hypothetical protein
MYSTDLLFHSRLNLHLQSASHSSVEDCDSAVQSTDLLRSTIDCAIAEIESGSPRYWPFSPVSDVEWHTHHLRPESVVECELAARSAMQSAWGPNCHHVALLVGTVGSGVRLQLNSSPASHR